MIIQSDKLNMRKTEVDDITFVKETESDSSNQPFIGQWTVEQHVEALKNEDIVHLIIENKQGARVGYAILSGFLDSNKAVCVKRIANQMKGQGYGKEAMRLIQKWVFESTETHRIWLDVKDFNERARHVYDRVGFIFEGTLRDSLRSGDRYESLSIMSILRHEYAVH